MGDRRGDDDMTISYLVEPGRTGWNIIRYDSESGDRRPVDTAFSEYAAHIRANLLKTLATDDRTTDDEETTT